MNRGGAFGSPRVELSSVTLRDPSVVRFQIKNAGASGRKLRVYWDLECWKKGPFGFNDRLTDKSATIEPGVGAGKVLTRTLRIHPASEWCELWVNVRDRVEQPNVNGKISLKLQAQYD